MVRFLDLSEIFPLFNNLSSGEIFHYFIVWVWDYSGFTDIILEIDIMGKRDG